MLLFILEKLEQLDWHHGKTMQPRWNGRAIPVPWHRTEMFCQLHTYSLYLLSYRGILLNLRSLSDVTDHILPPHKT